MSDIKSLGMDLILHSPPKLKQFLCNFLSVFFCLSNPGLLFPSLSYILQTNIHQQKKKKNLIPLSYLSINVYGFSVYSVQVKEGIGFYIFYNPFIFYFLFFDKWLHHVIKPFIFKKGEQTPSTFPKQRIRSNANLMN